MASIYSNKWHVAESRGTAYRAVRQQNGELVAEVANEHIMLVAAAPELVEALSGLLEFVELNFREPKPGTYYGDRVIAARNAIAKAKR